MSLHKILLALLLLPVNVGALQSSIRFSQLSIEDGLAAVVVNDIIQDQQGFMWFATDNGLSRFDGYGFQTFRHLPDDEHSLAHNRVRTLYVDASGTLWVTTSNRWLHRFDPATDRFQRYRYEPKETGQSINGFGSAMIEDNNSTLWVGTRRNGVFRLFTDSDRLESIEPRSATDETADWSQIRDFSKDREGNIWVAANRQLAIFVPQSKQIVPVQQPAGGFTGNIRRLFTDDSGFVWIGTNGGGLYRFDPGTDEYINYLHDSSDNHSISGNSIQSIGQDRDGKLWIGTFKNGLNRFDAETGRFSRYRQDPSGPNNLPDNLVQAIYQDRAGVMWIGTYNAGVAMLDPWTLNFGHYVRASEAPDCLSNNSIYAIYQDSRQNLWVGNYAGGLHRINLNDGSCRHYSHNPDDPESLSDDTVYSILEDHLGAMWLGTSTGGLNRYDPITDKFEHYQYAAEDSNSISSNTVYSIYEDSADRLWIGTLNAGLNRFNRETGAFHRYQWQADRPDSLSDNRVNAILEDGDRMLWIATERGLSKLKANEQGFSRYLYDPTDTSYPGGNVISAIHEDSNGRLWLGTEGGLNLFDKSEGTVKTYTTADGLSDNKIYRILEDAGGSLWLSTQNGLAKFNSESEAFEHYDAVDGLQGNDFTWAAYRNPDSGQMFFAGINGFNAFYPNQIQRSGPAPAIEITRFALNNQQVPFGELLDPGLTAATDQKPQLVLTHLQRHISFEFSALSYSAPDKNQYAYMLEGFDANWIAADSKNRRATYTNLDPGDYTFRVKGSNHHGIWNDEGRVIKMKVLPSPWKTWWAYSLYILAVMLAIAAVFRNRIMALQRRAQALEQAVDQRTQEISRQKQTIESLLIRKNALFANVSHEFRTPLTLITGRAQELMKLTNRDNEKSRLMVIKRNAMRLLRMVEQMLELARFSREQPLAPTAVHLPSMINILCDSFASLVNEKQLTLQVADIDDICAWGDTDAIEKILLNLLSNAVKFTDPGGTILISVKRQPGQRVTISVTDTGRGISDDQQKVIFERFAHFEETGDRIKGAGIGLSLVQELAQALGGAIHLQSTPGQGSVFTVNLPSTEMPAEDIQAINPDSAILELEKASASEPFGGGAVNQAESTDQELTTVLIIEDSRDMRDYIADCLSDSYACLQADNGEAGISIAIEQIPDLIVCDIMMPVKDGFEVIAALRADERTCHIPFVILTAKGDRDSRLKGWRELTDEYLIKPFDKDELLIRIGNLLQLRNLIKRRMERVLFGNLPISSESSIAGSSGGNADSRFLSRLESIITQYYQDPQARIGNIAADMAMSERQLHRKLKALLNYTPSEYVRAFRLKAAAGRLRHGEPASAVAFDVGFSAHSYFSQCFKAQFGVTPKVYQDHIMSDSDS